MAEVAKKVDVQTCRGCNRQFDDLEDVCQIGSPKCALCRRCHITALGQPQPHKFNDKELR